eukprot:SM000041S15439  [mRNA]  locus=s41:105499:111602:+ [translate_table: standard]
MPRRRKTQPGAEAGGAERAPGGAGQAPRSAPPQAAELPAAPPAQPAAPPQLAAAAQPAESVVREFQEVRAAPPPRAPSEQLAAQFAAQTISSAPQAAPGLPVAAPPQAPQQDIAASIEPSQQAQGGQASSHAVVPPPRPGYGTIGRKVVLRANHFAVTLQDITIYHYDVAITPSVTSKGVNRAILEELAKQAGALELGNRHLAYDASKSLFTAGQLPFTQKTFTVNLPDKDGSREGRLRTFNVAIKMVNTVGLEPLWQFLQGRELEIPQEIFQAYDIAFRASSAKSYIPVGRSFFSDSLGQTDLTGGLRCYQGFFQSLRPTQQGLVLNIDSSATAFFEPLPVVQFIEKLLNMRGPLRGLQDRERVKVRKALLRLQITVTHRETPRKYRVTGVTREPAQDLQFEADGENVSLIAYFQQKYNYKIRFPQLPCIVVGSKKSWLPMEVCVIAKDQRYLGKLGENQVRNMLKFTCKRPPERARFIQNLVAGAEFEREPIARDFGLGVKPEMMTVQGRLLPPPNLIYGDQAQVQPKLGAWNLLQHRFHEGKQIDRWMLLSFAPPNWVDTQTAMRFGSALAARCNQLGMRMRPEPAAPLQQRRLDQLEVVLKQVVQAAAAKAAPLQLIVIILPDKVPEYNDLKRVCETELDVPSQCCLSKHVPKCDSQYLANLAMKINAKVGGRNVQLQQEKMRNLAGLSEVPTMILGADVTHAAPGDEESASIAAVVASKDWPCANKYVALVEAQPHRQEIISALYTERRSAGGQVEPGGMVLEHLKNFYRATGQKPARLIMFRDGVSEGQFYQVLSQELSAIKRACLTLRNNDGRPYNPRITFIIVQKRHHTRLFATDQNTDRSGNVMPGTVVDTQICHPREFDFYLCSHAGIQGTSRPTHYHALWDENGFTADALQQMCNNLCYTYARCTRSVSIVPPAYYAHLAAFRARLYSENSTSGSDAASSVRPLSTSSLLI